MSLLRMSAQTLLFAFLSSALWADDLSAQDCGCCTEGASSHRFSTAGEPNSCVDGNPDNDWVDCESGDGECHSTWWVGGCDVHDPCFFEEEDADALSAALDSGQTERVTAILSPLAEEVKLTYVADRTLLLVSGCNGAYVAGFPLASSGVRRAVLTVVTGGPIDR